MSTKTNLNKTKGFDVWFLIGKTNQKVHRALNKRLDEIGLSLPQHEILMAVFLNPDSAQKEIAQKLVAVKSNVSMHIDRLEKKGLIVRKRDKVDSRVRRLSLSESAESLVSRSFEIQNDLIRSMVESVNDKELEMLGQVMNRVGDVLDEIIDS